VTLASGGPLALAGLRAPDVWGERVAVETSSGVLDYSALGALSRAGARELGVGAGERVAIALPPGREFTIALHACFAAGALAVPVDLREPPERWPAAAALVDRPLVCGGRQVEPRVQNVDDVAVVLRTSGTMSGTSIEVPLTFGNFLWSAIGSAVALGLDPQERWLCTLPLTHVGGLSILIRSALYGTTAVVHERFDAQAAVAALMTDRITVVSVVATTLVRLLDAGLDSPPSLRCALAGGGPVPAALIERAEAVAVPVVQTYGLTETCSQVATQVPSHRLTRDAGPPLFCTRVEIAADREILVSGPTISPAAGAVLATGDLGEIDGDGSLRVIGRKAETIISGGENVSPSEVEAALCEHPAVAEAAVFGIPDPEWGEAVRAHVVLRAPVSTQALHSHCASRLAPYQLPKQILIVETLPRTASGKLRRVELASEPRR
jgi:O-succinylbenzoic acid--CoA ligase